MFESLRRRITGQNPDGDGLFGRVFGRGPGGGGLRRSNGLSPRRGFCKSTHSWVINPFTIAGIMDYQSKKEQLGVRIELEGLGA